MTTFVWITIGFILKTIKKKQMATLFRTNNKRYGQIVRVFITQNYIVLFCDVSKDLFYFYTRQVCRMRAGEIVF